MYGDPNEIVDPHPEKTRSKKYRVIFLKCVRARYWWPQYVVGYYRWYWMANLVGWWTFQWNSGDVWIEKGANK